jgi:hypothetical protein
MDEDVVHSGAFTRLSGETPIEAGGLEGHDEMRQPMLLHERLGLGEEAIDFVGTAVEAATPQHVAIVRERSGLPFAGQVDAQDQRVTRNPGATTSAFVLLAAKTARDERSW